MSATLTSTCLVAMHLRIANAQRRCRFLFQSHSWAPFNLSRTALRQIVTAVGPHPEFLRLFRGFGEPPSGYQTDFSGGYSSHAEGACDASSSAERTGGEGEPQHSTSSEKTIIGNFRLIRCQVLCIRFVTWLRMEEANARGRTGESVYITRAMHQNRYG